MSEHREEIFGDKPWPDYCTIVPAQRVGNTICHSGTTAIGDNSVFPVPGNIEKQTRQIFRKFDRLLKAAGGSCENIIATTDFFITTENYNRTGKVRGEFLRGARPTATGVTSVLRRAA